MEVVVLLVFKHEVLSSQIEDNETESSVEQRDQTVLLGLEDHLSRFHDTLPLVFLYRSSPHVKVLGDLAPWVGQIHSCPALCSGSLDALPEVPDSDSFRFTGDQQIRILSTEAHVCDFESATGVLGSGDLAQMEEVHEVCQPD